MAENPVAGGLLRAFHPAVRAAYKGQRLGRRWDKVSPERRRKLMEEMEVDLAQAHSLVKSAIVVARHRREA